MKKILFLLSFIIFFNYSAYAEEWVNIYANSGDKLQIALPDGYCDFTLTDEGQFYLNHLNKTKRNVPGYENFEAKIVYSLCGKVKYPWGYILLNNEKFSSSYTQIDLNKHESSSFNKTYAKEIKENVNKSHGINSEDIKIKSLGVPEVVWEDENALIFYQEIKGNIEGKKFTEEVTASAFLFNSYGISMYLYEEEGAQNALQNSQLLLNAAKSTKSR